MPGYGKTVGVRQWIDKINAARRVAVARSARRRAAVVLVASAARDRFGVAGRRCRAGDVARRTRRRRPAVPRLVGRRAREREPNGSYWSSTGSPANSTRQRSTVWQCSSSERATRCRSSMTTRAIPTLPLARWRSLGWLNELREEDLRLTDDEAIAIAHRFDPTSTTRRTLHCSSIDASKAGRSVCTWHCCRSTTAACRRVPVRRQFLDAYRPHAGQLSRRRRVGIDDRAGTRRRACRCPSSSGSIPTSARSSSARMPTRWSGSCSARGVFLTVVDRRTGAMRFHASLPRADGDGAQLAQPGAPDRSASPRRDAVALTRRSDGCVPPPLRNRRQRQGARRARRPGARTGATAATSPRSVSSPTSCR